MPVCIISLCVRVYVAYVLCMYVCMYVRTWETARFLPYERSPQPWKLLTYSQVMGASSQVPCERIPKSWERVRTSHAKGYQQAQNVCAIRHYTHIHVHIHTNTYTQCAHTYKTHTHTHTLYFTETASWPETKARVCHAIHESGHTRTHACFHHIHTAWWPWQQTILVLRAMGRASPLRWFGEPPAHVCMHLHWHSCLCVCVNVCVCEYMPMCTCTTGR